VAESLVSLTTSPRMPEPQGKDWILLEPDPRAVEHLIATLGIDPLVARLLANRHLTEPNLARTFLNPPLRDLPDPSLMADADLAAGVIADAILTNQKICVYGDYDVDGISAAALLHHFFTAVGHPAHVFLPDRFRDGYGLHPDRLAELADQGTQLFISVDCGSTAISEIAAMRARGLGFIVVDHHTLGAVLPDATALLNPKRLDCRYPDKHLSAVGVALVLATAVRRALASRGHAGGRVELKGLLELAALGTIADMVPLRGVNRTLAWHGLRQLGASPRAGIRALAAQSGATQGSSAIGADRVGFSLGPRINAAGRVADPHTAFHLLTTADEGHAKELAERIEIENNRRKTLQASVTASALLHAADQPGRGDAVVVMHADWHQGVVGIVANRLKDEFGVPAFVLAVGEDGMARGSGRSVPGYDLVEGLRACCHDGLADRFGGHAFAAGITLPFANVDLFRERLAAHVAETLPFANRRQELKIDAELDLRDATLDMLDRVEQLEPFGKDNPRPLFVLRGVEVAELAVVGKDKDWVRCRFLEPGRQPAWARKGIAGFGAAGVFEDVLRGETVDVVMRLERNAFRGSVTLQATVEAVAPAGKAVHVRTVT
jgi:single-stranded-DNA-specific exonuclease